MSAEKEGKPSYTKSEGQIWDENMLFRYNFYSDDTNLRVLPSYGSLGAYVTRDLDENTKISIGQDALDSINGDKIKIDGNHELAGKVLHFDVEVVEVRDATEEELTPPSCGSGCGGGCGGCGSDCGGDCSTGCGGCGCN